jgi:hypothetical protein
MFRHGELNLTTSRSFIIKFPISMNGEDPGCQGEVFYLKQKSVEMITLSAKERYLRYIEKFPQIIQNAPLKHIATYLGITDTSLSSPSIGAPMFR